MVQSAAFTIILNILAGIAVVLASVALVYITTLLFDKYASLCHGDAYVLTPEELTERQNASDLTKRAGLAGILQEERVRIFRHFFTQRALPYLPGEDDDNHNSNKTENENVDSDLEAQKSPPDETISSAAPSASGESNDENDQELEDLCMMEHHEATCPICLSEYGTCREAEFVAVALCPEVFSRFCLAVEGDKVITGSSCSHKFHLECGMQWLEKGNDHCAYCRKDMMKPEEMTQAAREELGDARVDKITHINAMAEKRLEEYQAALAAGADNTEVSRQFALGTMPGDHQRILEEGGAADSERNDNETTQVTNV
jgi:hypothetical protein